MRSVWDVLCLHLVTSHAGLIGSMSIFRFCAPASSSTDKQNVRKLTTPTSRELSVVEPEHGWKRDQTPTRHGVFFISFPRSDRYGTSGSGPFLRGLDSSWSRCWRPLLSTFIFSWFLIPDFWISKLRHSSGIIIKTQMNQLLQDPGHRSVSVGEPFNPLMDGLQLWHWARLCSCVCVDFYIYTLTVKLRLVIITWR